MTSSHWHVLIIYFGFTLIGTFFALAKRWIKPKASGGDVWRKYPTYILINLFFLGVSWYPPQWHILTVVLAILGGLASWEIIHALQSLIMPSPRLIYMLFPYTTFLLIGFAGWLDFDEWLRDWLVVFLVFVMLNTIAGQPEDYVQRILAVVSSIIYFPVCLVAYLALQRIDGTGFTVVFLYLTIAVNDAMAQITGELFGRRALIPRISPSKTVEGALGGIIFASLMGMALSNILGRSYFVGMMMGLAMGLAGLLGDLTASVWKRALGLKNFSALLGAQGGVLDRFDGLIFAAPVFYLLLVWF